MYLVLSAFTSSPISLVATARASAFSVTGPDKIDFIKVDNRSCDNSGPVPNVATTKSLNLLTNHF